MKIINGYEAAKQALSREVAPVGVGNVELEDRIREWVNDVRLRGDAAVREYTKRFDNVELGALEVPAKDIDAAYASIDNNLRDALETAAERIAAFHQEQKNALVRDKTDGSLGWVMLPLERVGVLAPGFQAPLPSSVLMSAVPARVAGVKELVVVSPPGRSGKVSPVTLAAAKIAGVNRIFSIGGAQAVAALAYGTESVPRVDMICGPGNMYVTLAKKIVYGSVGIDGLYGPSEVIIVADDTADPAYCAADLLGQAEHGSLATAMLITTSQRLAGEVNEEVERQLKTLDRHEVIIESLEKRGLIAVVETMEQALELADRFAPEHLCIVTENAGSHAGRIKNAGCLFIGEHAIEVLVDYVAGPSHVLPTEGTARFSSPLNILDFVKLMTVVKTDEKDIRELGKAASVIARAEGLDAHARAVEMRLEAIDEKE